ncbi:P-loop containing nucleoside triphosphate hydrolases superfamily protein [Artemisia annua]|uniref:P-loop containing nucleoside triphosphate hydrolases superfamily protein n=1 Tax=Artemisia annua TaxID=35608 RepID=A0A2U1KZJ0_ARTAN|nr:P-loop containing nucleoside triphosphate hydrolases superfamily protein [Artemisia annua]
MAPNLAQPLEGVTAAQIEHELLRLVVDGRDENDTFKEFPYYLSERTRWLLTSAAYVHLKHLDVSKHTRNLSPASRAILLSGPAEFYHEKLAKALSHEFEAKLLVLDIVDFSGKMQSKYGTSKKDSFVKRSISDMALERVSSLLGSFSTAKEDDGVASSTQSISSKSRSTEIINHPAKIHRNSSNTSLASLKRVSNYPFDEKAFLQELYKVLMSFSETNGIILYIKDIEKFLHSPRAYKLFDKMLKRLSGSTLVIGSRMSDKHQIGEVSEKIGSLFPYNIDIKPPEDESLLIDWKAHLEEQTKKSQFQDNMNHIAEVLAENDLELASSTQSISSKSRSTEIINHPAKIHRNSSNTSLASLKRVSNYPFDEKAFLQELYKVLMSFSETNGIILYIKDIEKFLHSPRAYKLFDKMLKRLSGSTLVIGSRMSDKHQIGEVSEKIGSLFPYNIDIKPPEDESLLIDWKAHLEEQTKKSQFQDNMNHIAEVLAENDLECDDLGAICQADTMFISNYIQEIVISAISHHLMSHKEPEYRNGKLVISSTSLSHGLSIFQEDNCGGKDTLKLESKADSSKGPEGEENVSLKSDNKNETEKSVPPKPEVPDNEFEKRIRPEVIPANEIGVTFSDIGALDEIKETLQELVMLPLKRPDLFNGGLLKPCRGILLFGPPGTGKTMLAKAIANDAGASFINVSMSTITSKWFGEDEKNVRALFTLAAKVSPTIIFVDEVDSMLGQRTRVGEHEAMRKIKNEFMSHWDGLLTKPGERILVLAATNRPFDLDEAIIRRFERRIMVGLPSVENREMILKTLLAKEKIEDLDFKELAVMTEGYSGSDLKNLCVTAAYRPVRELMQEERQKNIDKKKSDETKASEDAKDTKEAGESVVKLRHLNMEDMRQAKNQVAASFAGEGSVMGELKQWNELYGEGGSRKKEQLSYFL